jgi:hypothetical protein
MKRAVFLRPLALIGVALAYACDLSPQPLPPNSASSGTSFVSMTGSASGTSSSSGQTPDLTLDAGSPDASSLGATASPNGEGGPRPNDGGPIGEVVSDAMSRDGEAPGDVNAGFAADASEPDGPSDATPVE